MENIILVLSLIVGAIGVIRFKRLTMPFKLLVLWQLVNFLIDSCNQLCIAVYKNNALLSHVDNICEYIVYALIYYYLFISKAMKKAILGSIAIVVIFFIINGLFLQPFTKTFPTNLIMINETVDVLLAILLFKQMLQYPIQINITKQSIFWFNTAISFFSTTMFLNLQLLNYYGRYHREDMTLILYFWYSIDIIFSILLCLAILNDRKEEMAYNR